MCVTQSICGGLLQRQRMAPYPRRRKHLFPECLAGCSHGTLVLSALGRWEGPAHILAQRGGCPTESRCPFHPPLRERYSCKPLQAEQDAMFKAHPSAQLQALFVQPRRPRVFACFVLNVPEAGERACDAPGMLLATRQS